MLFPWGGFFPPMRPSSNVRSSRSPFAAWQLVSTAARASTLLVYVWGRSAFGHVMLFSKERLRADFGGTRATPCCMLRFRESVERPEKERAANTQVKIKQNTE